MPEGYHVAQRGQAFNAYAVTSPRRATGPAFTRQNFCPVTVTVCTFIAAGVQPL